MRETVRKSVVFTVDVLPSEVRGQRGEVLDSLDRVEVTPGGDTVEVIDQVNGAATIGKKRARGPSVRMIMLKREENGAKLSTKR